MDTEPAVVHIDHIPQEMDIDTAAHLPDRLLAVPDIPDHRVGRMAPAEAGRAAEKVDSRAAVLPFYLKPNSHSLQSP